MNRWPAVAVFLGIVFPITAVAPGQFESRQSIQPNDVVTVVFEESQTVADLGANQNLPGKKLSKTTFETRVTEVLSDGRFKLHGELISARQVQTRKRTLRSFFTGEVRLETHKVLTKTTLSGVVAADKVAPGNFASTNDMSDLRIEKADLPAKR